MFVSFLREGVHLLVGIGMDLLGLSSRLVDAGLFEMDDATEWSEGGLDVGRL